MCGIVYSQRGYWNFANVGNLVWLVDYNTMIVSLYHYSIKVKIMGIKFQYFNPQLCDRTK